MSMSPKVRELLAYIIYDLGNLRELVKDLEEEMSAVRIIPPRTPWIPLSEEVSVDDTEYKE